MKPNDFRTQALDLISEQGAQYEIDGDTIVWWFEIGKKFTTKVPPNGGGDYRALKNHAAPLKRALEAAKPAYFAIQNQTEAEKNKWQEYLDKCIGAVKSEFDAKLETLRSDINASTDIALEAGLKVDNITKAFGSIFGQQSPSPVITQPAKTVQEVAPPQVKTAKPIEEPKKGLEALETIQRQQWAEIIERMNADFDLDEFDLRILFFLHETRSAQTAHTFREAGVWCAVSSVTKHLENMEAEGWVVPVADKWGITKRGISKLQDAYNEAEQDDTPADPSAFEEMEAARGEPNHAKMVKVYTPPAQPGAPPVLTSVEAAKPPVLTVVPIEQKPKSRILTPVPTSTYTFGVRSVKDDMLVYLYMREQAWSKSHTEPFPGRTSAEMKADSVRGYGPGEKDVGTAASMAKQTGHLTQTHKGAPYSLTSIGRMQAKRALSESVNGSDLNRRFV